MFRAHLCALLGIGLMLAAASTQARELDLSVDTRIGGDNNVFRTTRDEKADGFWELSPTIALRTRNEKLNYDFNYTPTYSTYFESSGVDGFDHRGQGVLSWRPTPVDTIDLYGNYKNVRLVREVDVSAATDPPLIEESDRERYQVSNVRLSYNRALSARWSVKVSGSFDDYDYSRDTSIDSRGYGAEFRTQYAWRPITIVGLSTSYRRRHSDSNGFSRPKEQTDIVNVSGFVQHSLTPTINVSVQAGPSFIDSEQDFSTPLIPDSTDSSTSYFALVRAEKQWLHSKVIATYTRSESAGGGSATTSILDDVKLDVHHRFDQKWSARATASWVHRKEIARTVGTSREETTQYLGFFTLTRRLTRQLSVSGQYSFIHQDQDETVGRGSIGTIHTGYVSLRYTFDPVVF